MKVLFAASEAVPFIKTGGLGDVAGALPKALCEKGVDARVILPLYQDIPEKWKSQMNFLKGSLGTIGLENAVLWCVFSGI